MTVAAPDLTARGIVKRYRGTLALERVDLRAAVGVTGLLGPNGAGKTTLLRILATALRADAGELTILGHDAADATERHAIRTQLGYQPQEPGFFQGFTVAAFLDYVGVLKEISDRRVRTREVRRVIEELGLDEVAARKIRRLSGGMRRRVAIAQALLGRPRVVLLDEPTAGLDPEQRLRFREVVSRLAEDATVILSTHQTDDVAALCDRVVVLVAGAVRFSGTCDELARLADGHVWIADRPGPPGSVSWRTGTSGHRIIGPPCDGARPAFPTIEDGYLMLVGHRAEHTEASA